MFKSGKRVSKFRFHRGCHGCPLQQRIIWPTRISAIGPENASPLEFQMQDTEFQSAQYQQQQHTKIDQFSCVIETLMLLILVENLKVITRIWNGYFLVGVFFYSIL